MAIYPIATAHLRTYLKKAVLIESPRRGVFNITARGLAVPDEGLKALDAKDLARFSEFQEFQRASQSSAASPSAALAGTCGRA
jgi:restriction system protein